MEYSAAILRNKGVQVDVAVLSQPSEGKDGTTPEPTRLTTPDGDPKTAQRWVRFDANAIADLEDAFGSLADFEEISRTAPFRSVRQALSIVWGTDVKTTGKMMLEGRISDYSTAVGVALALANGVDPTQAGRLLRIGVKASTRMTTERDKALAEAIEEGEAETEEEREVEEIELVEPEPTDDLIPVTIPTDLPDETLSKDSPGTTGLEVGSEPDGDGTSSGS